MNNYVEFEGKKYETTQAAYYSGNHRYQAAAIDEDGNDYIIYWDMTADAIRYEDATSAENLDDEEKAWLETNRAKFENDEAEYCDWSKVASITKL